MSHAEGAANLRIANDTINKLAARVELFARIADEAEARADAAEAELASVREDLTIANERGDEWRRLYNEGTDKLAALKARVEQLEGLLRELYEPLRKMVAHPDEWPELARARALLKGERTFD